MHSEATAVPKNFANFENTCVEVSFFQSCKPSGLQLYLKKTPTQVFSCEICEILKTAYFEEHLQMTASVY